MIDVGLLLLQGWPVFQPDILVSTPAALLNYLYAFDAGKNCRAYFFRNVKYVVFVSVLVHYYDQPVSVSFTE